jgi:malate dehydrogenase (oxaloacetate-decarboxylating)
MPRLQPSASYSVTIRTENPHTPGMVGRISAAIGDAGGLIGAIDVVEVNKDRTVRDFVVAAADAAEEQSVVDAVRAVPGVRVIDVADRTFQLHSGGKIEVTGRCNVKTSEDLSMVYTPGVARVCLAIRDDPSAQWRLTIKPHTIAVVTDGSAVLGLGNIGPAAAQPVMEGKCLIFKAFAGVDAFPLCLATQDTDEIVETVRRVAPVFGGINLEDIAAPRCFEVEDRLRRELDIPVMHDDQHGTAIVVLAALKNALLVVGKSIHEVKIVIAGAGAAGNAVARMLTAAGARHIVLTDRAGALSRDRVERMDPYKCALAEATNPLNERGNLAEVLRGADVFIGVAGPGIVSADDIRAMGRDPIVFAMANPIPEIQPEALTGIARVVATGRSDYANQINNSLAFPGVFRGALDARARDISAAMKLAAVEAIAGLVTEEERDEEYILPSMFDRRVADAVATAVRKVATLEVADRPGGAQR